MSKSRIHIVKMPKVESKKSKWENVRKGISQKNKQSNEKVKEAERKSNAKKSN